ncbi:pyrimidine dimer DNA glycosylase [Streptococcus agalactiae LMG 14747]|uniref:Pyrimidine dimer DNA glycosylase n=2 Tax=Streptococcus TaxID=1301 RepID=V6YZW9_STRAG|nr:MULTISPECIES: TIGR02328 family protein [Streptococcus]ESV54255.1 pyrimidine dimer DNA glycosylase [Streptococcus agalactiae LMG 14747]MDY5974007.1 TIGR02328 family protein [Streptococcus hyovaginalis]SNV39431.1 Pyrimidine dimer DNA glycosylase [Streptococcus acidominimus]
MRLWHEALLSQIPRQQLLGQHRECAALRGGGWGKPHATVNYVFAHSPYKLFQYHTLVMDEMLARGYHPDKSWRDPAYRGKRLAAYDSVEVLPKTTPIYPEHDDAYLKECLTNLAGKGIVL